MSVELKRSVTLLHKTSLTSHVLLLTFRLFDGHSLEYTPGQFATFIISPSIRRSYSFAGWSEDRTSFDLLVDTHPGGPGSQYFLGLEEGASADILAPLGKFGAIEGSTRPSIFIATGTGIAPFRSMLQKEFSAHSKTLDSGQATTTTGENGSPTGSGMTEKKKIHLFWGLRHEEDIYLQEELEKLTEDRGLKTEDGVEKSTEFQYSIVLSQPKEDWAGDRGHVTEHVLEFAKANRQDYDWYLCGNNQMIKEVEEGLKVLGVPPEQMKKDAYY